MLTELLLWEMFKKKEKTFAPARPDGFSGKDRMQTYYTPRLQGQVMVPVGPINPTAETVPSGENREVFALTAPGTFTLLANPENISVEVNEVLIVASVAGNVQLLVDEKTITPVLPLGIGGSYSDSGFRLPRGSALNISLPDTAVIEGFVRWRYR